MEFMLYRLPLRCLRCAVNLTGNLAVDARCKLSQVATLSNQNFVTRNAYESPKLNFLHYQNLGRKHFLPSLNHRQILHTSPEINKDANKIDQNTAQNSVGAGQQGEPPLNEQEDQSQDKQSENEEPKGLIQRFKQTYKEYGKILIGVHVFTSCIWASSFYYAAASGVDVIAVLRWLGASEKMITPFTLPGVGYAAVAYLMYKLATPLRYAVTITGTRFAVKIFRKWGYLPPIPEKNRIRSLVKEGQQKMKERGRGKRL